jgi:hypothetical protein
MDMASKAFHIPFIRIDAIEIDFSCQGSHSSIPSFPAIFDLDPMRIVCFT